MSANGVQVELTFLIQLGKNRASPCLLPVRETEEERARSNKAEEAMLGGVNVDGQRDENKKSMDRT